MSGSEIFLVMLGESFDGFSFFGFGLRTGEASGDFLDRPEPRLLRMLPRAASGLDWVTPDLSRICSGSQARVHVKYINTVTVEPHLSSLQLSGCSDYLTIELMIFIGFLLCIK